MSQCRFLSKANIHSRKIISCTSDKNGVDPSPVLIYDRKALEMLLNKAAQNSLSASFAAQVDLPAKLLPSRQTLRGQAGSNGSPVSG